MIYYYKPCNTDMVLCKIAKNSNEIPSLHQRIPKM